MTPFKEVPPRIEPPLSGVDQLDRSVEGLRPGVTKPAQPSSPRNPAELKVIGRYDILSRIGSGGMGEVFRAFDQQTLEEVALKLLQPESLSDPTRSAMFRREVRLARKVAHRNVARVFDFGIVGDLPYLTMEYIEGVSLSHVIASDQYPTDDQVLDVMLGLARGLSAAHQAGLIHRGIKPGNVIVGTDGRVVLTDFGLSPLREEKERLNSKMGGAPLYMAPEQVLSGILTVACDCYSLGLLAYELATKRLPFQSSGFAQVMVRLQLSPSDPRAHRPEISEGVSAIIRRCLYRDPADRWESMSDLVYAIERLRAPTRIAIPVQRAPSEPLKKQISKITVLPIRASPQELGDLSAGLAEDLVDELSSNKSLRIALSENSGSPLGFSSPQRGFQDADAVIEGTLCRLPMGLRLNIRLLRVPDGETLWARRIDCLPTSLLALPSELAREVLEAASIGRTNPSPTPDGADTPTQK